MLNIQPIERTQSSTSWRHACGEQTACTWALGRAGRRAKDQMGWPRSYLRVGFFSDNPPQWNSQYLEGLTKSTIPAGCWPTRAQCIQHFTVHLLLFLPVNPPSSVDPTRINLMSTIAVNYWCSALHCSETQLRNAILAVGLLPADVKAYLSR